MSPRYEITRKEAIEQVLADLDGPTPLDEVCDRVLDLWPSQAKDPTAGIRKEIRRRHAGWDVIFLDDQTVVPMPMAMQGLQFRITPSQMEVNQGIIRVDPWLQHLSPPRLKANAVRLVDAKGRPLRTRIKMIREQVNGVFGANVREIPALNLVRWFRKHRVKTGDSLLLTIEDWESGRYRLEHEPAAARHDADVARWDAAFADRVFAMLEHAYNESIPTRLAITTTHARMRTFQTYPGHHWTTLIKDDPRMRDDGYEIRYSDTPTSWSLFPYEQPIDQVAFMPEEGQQVYRFKVGRRRIEIQGAQSLFELDDILRTAFGYTHHDHLSGFWKRIRRGDSNRFREVDVGTVDPFEGGNAADVAVAGLGLAAGQTLKYVYDFGDWFEQRLVLEAITAPEPDVDYPRLVGQRKSHP
jgi:hypothetical protein